VPVARERVGLGEFNRPGVVTCKLNGMLGRRCTCRCLYALVHEAETASDDRLAGTREVIRKTQAADQMPPNDCSQALGNSALARDAVPFR